MNFPGALNDVTILDLSRVLACPFATMQLGDMGANIIKIENPVGGDDTRSWGPVVNGTSAYFAAINRNKRSVTLDLKSQEGKQILIQMVKKADVLIENYRPNTMKKLGLGYDTLKEVNDRLIYASVSGFGTYGRYSNRSGYDVIAQAMGGLMSVTGFEDNPPTKVGTSIADITSGMNLVMGVLAALYARERTKKGQRIEVALVDTVISCCTIENMRYLVAGKIPSRIGNRNASLCPYGAIRAKDGDFVIACGNQKLFEQLCLEVMHRPDLMVDERFKDMPSRVENHKAVTAEVEAFTMQYSVEENLEMISRVGIPCAPIYDISDITADTCLADEREMIQYLEQPGLGNIRVTGNPIKFTDTKTSIRMPAPLLGQHTETILHEMLGIDEQKMTELRTKGVI